MDTFNQPVTIYISAAADLMAEREALARTIAELPVTLAWHIAQTPLDIKVLNDDALAAAEFYFLIFGGDIRAPVGLEFETALQNRALKRGYLKRGVGYTPAGQAFIQRVRHQISWHYFDSLAQLSRQIQVEVASHLLHRQLDYALSPAETANLAAVLNNAANDSQRSAEHKLTAEGTGHSAVLLSRERFMPSDGVLIEKSPEE